MYNYYEDKFGKECLSQAKEGKGKLSFGAVLVKNNKIIGRGRNRLATKSDRDLLTHVDYAIHAEQDSVVDALKKGIDVNNSEIYVLGIILRGMNKGKLTVRSEKQFGCMKCPPTFEKYNIKINIPYITGWVSLSPEEARITAKFFCGDGKWKKFADGLISI